MSFTHFSTITLPSVSIMAPVGPVVAAIPAPAAVVQPVLGLMVDTLYVVEHERVA